MTVPDPYADGRLFFHQVLTLLGQLMNDDTLSPAVQDRLENLAREIRTGAAPLLDALALASPRITIRLKRTELTSFLAHHPDFHAIIGVAPAVHIPSFRRLLLPKQRSVRWCTRPGDVRGLLADCCADCIVLAPPPSLAARWWRVLLQEVPAEGPSALVYVVDEPEAITDSS
jgi:hypothetical protein